MSDVVIIGAGIIGTACALELEKRGIRTTLLEKAVLGAESSSAAAGMLAPQIESAAPDAVFELGLLGRSLYPEWVREIRAYAEVDVGYRVDGGLQVARSHERLAELALGVAWQAQKGLRVETIDAPHASALLPGLSDTFAGALYFPDEGQVDPRLLMRALSTAVKSAGVNVLTQEIVKRIAVRGGSVEGVELEKRRIPASRVVVAAGAWSGLLEGAGIPAGVLEPARGQMLALELPDRAPFGPFVFSDRGYLVPRKNGRILVGSTVERVGYDKAVTAEALLSLLDAAIELVPSLANARVAETWAGLRPWTQDQRPILGASPIGGLYLATGHYRNGILQAPATARVIADLIAGESPPIDLEPFSVERFSRFSR